jgi:two-component system sensor histidine kinase RegB
MNAGEIVERPAHGTKRIRGRFEGRVTMRVCVTDHQNPATPDLRSAGELAPSLALPWIVTLRYGVLIAQTLLLLLTHFVFGVTLPIAWCAGPLVLTAASNLWLQRVTDLSRVRPALGSILALDILCLTALLALSGGPANPFTLLYLVYITLSAVVLSKAWTWALGILAFVGFGFVFPVHVRVSIFEAHHTVEGFAIHLIGMWLAFAAAALLITVFIGKVSEALQKREQEVLLLQNQLARHERLASIATLAAGAAHELGTPLATIAVAAKDLELHGAGASRDSDVTEEARLIRAEVDRCRRILQQMSDRAAEPLGEVARPVDLKELLESVQNGFSPLAQGRLRTAVNGDGREAVLCADATIQALTALVKNALDASPDDQSVSLDAERTEATVRFTVRDSGPGMSWDMLKRLGEPFFTTKAPGAGMGLGIFLVRAYAERLEGNLVFESETGTGTKAVLELPATQEWREEWHPDPA